MNRNFLNTKPKIDGVVENIYNPDPDIVPNPTTLGDGQVAVNTSNTKPRLFIKKVDGSLATFEDATATQQRINAGGSTLANHISDTNNPHTVTAFQVGLGNVNNTSDVNKPISTATQTALDTKVDKVTGKQLSTNDFTTAEKTKLSGIETGAQVNNIDVKLGSLHDDIAPLVVDNTLSVTSDNPIANKAVATKFVENDNKIVQLEQDVDVMRSDVQGVNLNGSGFLEKDIVGSFSIRACVKSVSDLANSPIISIGEYLSLNRKCVGVRFGTGRLNIMICTGGSEWSVNTSLVTVGTEDIMVTYDGSNVKVYRNAQILCNVVIGEFNLKKYRLLAEGNFRFKDIVYMAGIFNTYLTQQQIDTLYNQGRCDEVVLGDEWRNSDIAVNDNFTKGTQEGDYFSYTGTSQRAEIALPIKANSFYVIKYDAKAKEGATFKPRIATDGAGNGYIGDTQFLSNGINQNIIHTNRTATKLIILNNAVSDVFLLKNLSIQAISVLNEYLPQYLTQTKWIDNGVSKQDISLTAPTFTYIKPYKDYQSGVSAPTVPPDAMGQIFYDVVARKKYECYGKSNTEQYGVGHWITK